MLCSLQQYVVCDYQSVLKVYQIFICNTVNDGPYERTARPTHVSQKNVTIAYP